MENIKLELIDEKYRQYVFELLSRLEEHSKESYEHSLDVAEKSLALAFALGIDGDDLRRLYVASLLHDVGKLFIESDLLHKQNATDEEREMIRFGHIQGTKQILEDVFDDEIVKIAFNHHERLDGSGYPDHFRARKLDVLDRILQVADVTSALIMSRSYKDAFAAEQVIEILDKLVKSGELDKKCVAEIERIFLIPLSGKKQPIL